jgi:hypothetical protein
MWARLLSRATLMLAHCAVLTLVIVSIIEVYELLAGIIRHLEKGNRIPLAGALAAALVPSGAMLFWAFRAIATQLILPTKLGRFSQLKMY